MMRPLCRRDQSAAGASAAAHPASSSRTISSALGGYNAISEKGLSIPEDVSVMGYDGIYLSPGGQASAGDLPAEHRRAGPHGCRQAH